jgi:hypothetical protein
LRGFAAKPACSSRAKLAAKGVSEVKPADMRRLVARVGTGNVVMVADFCAATEMLPDRNAYVRAHGAHQIALIASIMWSNAQTSRLLRDR